MRHRVSRERLPYLTAAAGALLIAFSGIFVRLADEAPATAAVFRCAYALPALLLLAERERRRFGPRSLRNRVVAWVAGVFFALDLVAWHYAIGYVGAGLATVLANTQVVFVALLAWMLLRERPDRLVLGAVPVVLVGTTLISGVFEEGAYGDDPVLGIVFSVVTALAYSAFILILRRGNRDQRRPAGPLFDATLAGAVCSVALGLVVGEIDLVPAWPSHGWLLLLALTSQVVAWLLISVSLPRLPAAVTSVLLTLQPVGAVVLGILLLAEAPTGLQLAGVAVVVAGIVLAAIAPRRLPPEPSPGIDVAATTGPPGG
jgi:drug/metabolite transporter (DMT)-like permease